MQQHLLKVLPVNLQTDLPSFISQQHEATDFFAAVQKSFGAAARAVLAISAEARIPFKNRCFITPP